MQEKPNVTSNETPELVYDHEVVYVYRRRIILLEQRDVEPTFTNCGKEWFVQFECSGESFSLGNDMPLWKVGDVIEVSYRKAR